VVVAELGIDHVDVVVVVVVVEHFYSAPLSNSYNTTGPSFGT
jgi:hypothetical protein